MKNDTDSASMEEEEEEEEEATSSTRPNLRLMDSKKKRLKKRRARRIRFLTSQQFQGLIALVVVLVACVVLEVIVVEMVFLGPGGRITNIHLSNADFFISDSGAIEEGIYLHSPKSQQQPSLYGEQPVILGLDSCQTYQATLEEEDGPSIAVFGLFQKYVTPFKKLLEKNCHVSPSSKDHWIYKPEDDHHTFPDNVLPIVVTQDPYPWMMDVCMDQPPELELDDGEQECPVRGVTVHHHQHHESLGLLWSEWHKTRLEDCLMIRLEDILLRAESVVGSICGCVGGKPHEPFRNKASLHVDKLPERLHGYHMNTLQALIPSLDAELMTTLHYDTNPGSME